MTPQLSDVLRIRTEQADRLCAVRKRVKVDRATQIASRVETFVHNVVVPLEKDPRLGTHGPSDDELRRSLPREPTGKLMKRSLREEYRPTTRGAPE